MKKETIFKHEINESIQANAALNCLKNRNTPKKLNESADFDARFEFRKDLRELASPVAKKAYMIIRKKYGDGMWRQLYMDDCDERGLIDMLNMYAEKGLNPQQIVNKMLGVREDEEEDTLNAYYSQDEPDYENDHHGIWLIINLMRKQGMLRAQGIEGRDDVDDGHAIDAAYDLIEQKLDEEGMWIGDDDHEAERFVSFYGEEIAAEAMKSAIHNQEQEESFDDAEDFISNVVNLMEDEGMIDNSQWDAAYYTVEEMIQSNPELLQYPSYKQFLNVFADDILSKLNFQEQEETSLDTEYFSDLEEQEAYYENFRAIAELVADQIDRENGKGIDNNMDTLFAIVREVWNNNPDDLYIYDFDDVQEDDCYKFFDKYYEVIKNEYLKREHNNIMDATHDDLFDGMMNN